MSGDLVRMARRIAAILDVLDVRPASGDEIARATGIPRATIYRYLTALTRAGRARRTRYGWRLPTSDELLEARDGSSREKTVPYDGTDSRLRVFNDSHGDRWRTSDAEGE
jgi:biotin operon repressor